MEISIELLVYRLLTFLIIALVLLYAARYKRIFRDFTLAAVGFISFAAVDLVIIYGYSPIVPYFLLVVGALSIIISAVIMIRDTIFELEHAAFHDQLTGLYNRRFIEEFILEEIKRSERFGGEFSILIIDLNDFKLVNDKYGHEKGDLVLKQIAHKLRNALRSYDVVGRLGGDEFIVVIPWQGCDGIEVVIERLLKETLVKFKDVTVSISIGYACYPEDGEDIETLLKVADKRMYEYKRTHKEYRKHAVDDKGEEEV